MNPHGVTDVQYASLGLQELIKIFQKLELNVNQTISTRLLKT